MKRATRSAKQVVCGDIISIHTLCEEGDPFCQAGSLWRHYFNPHPLWRGRRYSGGKDSDVINFNPHPLWRGRRHKNCNVLHCDEISIHTLCEEGDAKQTYQQGDAEQFQSTPSVKRATICDCNWYVGKIYFNPHPLWRGRLNKSQPNVLVKNFNPHPLWRGRHLILLIISAKSSDFNPHPLWRGRL